MNKEQVKQYIKTNKVQTIYVMRDNLNKETQYSFVVDSNNSYAFKCNWRTLISLEKDNIIRLTAKQNHDYWFEWFYGVL